MILSQLRHFWARLRSMERAEARRPIRDVRPAEGLEDLEIRKLPSVSAMGTTVGLGGAQSAHQSPSYGTANSQSKNHENQAVSHESGPNLIGPGHVIAMYATTGNTTITGGSGSESIVGGSGNDII